jgi:hypothetical protein
MRNVPVIGFMQVPSVETKSPVKQRPAFTPKEGYTGKQSFYRNIDGTISNSIAGHNAWDKDNSNNSGE